jgi:hypothetical protein
MEYFISPTPYDEALKKVDQRLPVASKLKSWQWSKVPVELRERAWFSATVENARFLQHSRDLLESYIALERETTTSGQQALRAGGRERFVKLMQQTAFAEGLGLAGEPGMGGIQDVSSEARLKLIFDTQVKAAESYAKFMHGQDPRLLAAFPAQRFIRGEITFAPRPLHNANTGVVKRKDDLQFWLSMNRADIGGFDVPWGPWGFNSGMDVEDVGRKEAQRLGLIAPGEVPKPTPADFNQGLSASTDGINPDILEKMRSALGDNIEEKGGRIYWKSLKGELQREEKAQRAKLAREKRKAERENPYTTDGWPKDLNSFEEVSLLGGSTGAKLVRHKATGEQFVMKRGANADHLREEVAADRLYRSAGVDVPEPRLYELPDGPVKLARYIDGAKTLGKWMDSATAAQKEQMRAQLRGNFLVDVALGNRDVIGSGRDNVLVTADGKAWRIDNGGSMRFRAMGDRKDFGPTATELSTMLDPKVNPTAQAIFSGLGKDEMRAQFTRLWGTADKIRTFLDAAPEDMRDVLSARLLDIQHQIFRGGAFPRDAAGRIITNQVDEEFVQRVRDARGSGRALAWDSDQLEDLQMLVWEETARTGEKVLKASFRLTEKGSRDVFEKLNQHLTTGSGGPMKQEIPPAMSDKVMPHPADTYWPVILDAAKTVGAHAKDGAYNQQKVNMLGVTQLTLKALKAQGDASGLPREMIDHYLSACDALDKAINTRTEPGKLTQWGRVVAAQPRPASIFSKDGFKASWSAFEFWLKDRKKGSLFETWTPNTFAAGGPSSETVRVQFEDGNFLQFCPWKKKVGAAWLDTGGMHNMRGQVEVTLSGGASLANIEKLTRQLARVGIKGEPATPEFAQLVAIRKTVRLRNWDTPEWDGITLSDGNDFEKLAKAREYLKKKHNVTLPDDITKLFATGDRWGNGWASVARLDLDFQSLSKEAPKVQPVHQCAGDLVELMKSITNGGGLFTSTYERLRTGVSLRLGMSPLQDMGTGGASYLFTRLRSVGSTYSPGHIVFKAKALLRADTVTYAGDRFGDTREDFRKRTLPLASDWARIAEAGGSDETLFKRGVNIFDDDGIDFVMLSSKSQAEALIAFFKESGYETWPDGRKLPDVIRYPGK